MSDTTASFKANPSNSVNGVRSQFLEYFNSNGHEVVQSAPLVPQGGDSTLLFVNAGMVPFKNLFTGAETPAFLKATSSQKCVRAGGKHNDLDNVGYTARHHTFFEMLGNFSFGDYFKEQAIVHAWNVVTKVFGLPVDKLVVTVFSEDDEAAMLWKKIAGLSDDKIIRISTSDNFWSMGDTGPCGPCSEIFYDHGPDVWGGPPGSPEEDGDRFIEIWNLVFMQFDQSKDGSRVSLPKPSIDTGMGLERIAAVLQGVHNNYEIDLFQNLIAAEEDVYGLKQSEKTLGSLRVISDHLRSSAFLIADGVTPSNEGRGYVLRRIMRRAMRHGHLLGSKEPQMHKLVPALVAEMGVAFPELGRAQASIVSTLEQEEGRFQRTLGRGLALLEDATSSMGKGDVLPGETAFKLYDTFGFPVDLTQDVLRAKGIEVDEVGFEKAMKVQRESSQASWQGAAEGDAVKVWFQTRDAHGATEFIGYSEEASEAELKTIIIDGELATTANEGQKAELVFDKTPFYGESGGQAGDRGEVRFAGGAVFRVLDTQKRAGDVFSHIGEMVTGDIKAGVKALLEVDSVRRSNIRSNHSATHILHAALRNNLGDHVTQKGSLVEEDKLRFDFAHSGTLSQVELDKIEAEVNAVIRQNSEVSTKEMAPDAAIEAGAMALFGEKYGDSVRVLAMGEALEGGDKAYSVELCGGIHVRRTGDIAVFAITSESGVSAGVRRIEAVTGAAALEYLKGKVAIARSIADQLKSTIEKAPERVAALQDQKRALENELSDAKKKLAMGASAGGAAAGPEEINGIKLLTRVADGVPAKDLRGLIDDAKKQLGSGVTVFVAVNDGKAAVATGVTDDLKDKISAVDLVKVAAAAVGGKGGGGRPDMAQAGGPDGSKANDAVDAVRAFLKS
ncbi:alanine--tRNA ligase [Hirschia baltica]|uniref:Alanine--tRNA ligase n=1 Tax=Hirschia baltica (strain ATCC 49814 / DSM 5838 / IFAM 1418) TaxID=582402 RepID=C6XLQ5_HIRBI|nr:alanine--tRNA ligase [Hirschia baltica]ACT57961.1 alanyl-tRNA synthetase [Hirschia baltica ATCC 49814]